MCHDTDCDEPLRIVKKLKDPKIQIKSDGSTQRVARYQMSNGDIGTLKELCQKYQIYATARARISKYGAFSPLVWLEGRVTPTIAATFGVTIPTGGGGIKEPKIQWRRSKCKRSSVACKHYGDCQTKRLGIVGSEPWTAPENTDVCYVVTPGKPLIWAFNLPESTAIINF